MQLKAGPLVTSPKPISVLREQPLGPTHMVPIRSLPSSSSREVHVLRGMQCPWLAIKGTFPEGEKMVGWAACGPLAVWADATVTQVSRVQVYLCSCAGRSGEPGEQGRQTGWGRSAGGGGGYRRVMAGNREGSFRKEVVTSNPHWGWSVRMWSPGSERATAGGGRPCTGGLVGCRTEDGKLERGCGECVMCFQPMQLCEGLLGRTGSEVSLCISDQRLNRFLPSFFALSFFHSFLSLLSSFLPFPFIPFFRSFLLCFKVFYGFADL